MKYDALSLRILVAAATAAMHVPLASCIPPVPTEMSGRDFCNYVVDPQHASMTEIRLERQVDQNYEFWVRRPAKEMLVRVPTSELELDHEFVNKPFPKEVPYGRLRLANLQGATGVCKGWFP